MECEVCVDGIHLEHVLEFKYLGYVLDQLGTVASGRRVAGAIRSLVNARVCSFSVLGSCRSHCWCLFLSMVVRLWWEKERSSIRAVQMDNPREVC